MNHRWQSDTCEIVEVAFEEVNPGPGKDYMCQPTIKTFLDEILLDRLFQTKESEWIIEDHGCGYGRWLSGFSVEHPKLFSQNCVHILCSDVCTQEQVIAIM